MHRMKYCVAALVGMILLAAPAVQAQTISTIAGWNGTEFTRSFGYDNTATYGQTFTSPGGQLTSFSFWLSNISSNSPITAAADLPFIAYVYAWDAGNVRATGSALFTSSTFFGSVNANGFDRYDFAVPSLTLSSGNTFVAFLSTSAFATRTPATNAMGTGSTSYAGGSFVFLNNGGTVSEWTTDEWSKDFCGAGCDAAFEATFTDGHDVVPEPATMTLLATGLAGMAAARRRKKSAV